MSSSEATSPFAARNSLGLCGDTPAHTPNVSVDV